MHEQNCRHRNKLQNEVAIADCVNTVFRNSREAEQLGNVAAIDRKACARQGAGAKRQHVDAIETAPKTLPIALEHLVVSKQMMGKAHRLCALQVCIAGHNNVQVLLGGACQLALKQLYTLEDKRNLFAQKKPRMQRDLIVATARRVQLLSSGADLLTQPAFDVHMNIFIG